MVEIVVVTQSSSSSLSIQNQLLSNFQMMKWNDPLSCKQLMIIMIFLFEQKTQLL